ncbi:hypothetical protein L7F22_027713 [Adiantum nelumboides]|nr:hypothetical protein [Adiantum nelumboides]
MDLSFPVELLAGFMSEPRKTHWHAALRILRFLRATPDRGIFYSAHVEGRPGDIRLLGWTDLDWAGELDSCRSTTGYCFTLGTSVISWSSKKHPTVALSSTEAEYRAACTGTCEAVWLRRLLGELGFPQQASTTIYSDNQSCLAIAKNPVFHARTKPIEVQYHYIREKLLDGTVSLVYCPTAENLADLFTKALQQSVVTEHSRSLGLLPHPGSA